MYMYMYVTVDIIMNYEACMDNFDVVQVQCISFNTDDVLWSPVP